MLTLQSKIYFNSLISPVDAKEVETGINPFHVKARVGTENVQVLELSINKY